MTPPARTDPARWAAAGATWWIDSVRPSEPGWELDLCDRIRRGPLR